MSLFAKRLSITFAFLVCFAFFGGVAASIVRYKPWGVHDLQREEYEQIISKIDLRAKIKQKTRPICVVKSVRNPSGMRLVGEAVSTEIVIHNPGSEDLLIDRGLSWPSGLESQQTFPCRIPFGKESKLIFNWVVPADDQQFSRLTARLTCNDPLNETLALTPECQVAKAFFVANELVGDAKPSNQKLVAVNHVFSQVHDEFFVECDESDPRIRVSFEPERDVALLKSHNARFGVRVVTELVAGGKPSKVSVPVKLVAWTAKDERKLEFAFLGQVKSMISFYGPDLDSRSGYRLGVIKIGSSRSWDFFARVKTDQPVSDLVAEVEPKDLIVQVTQARRDANDFRIHVTLSKNAKPMSFQGDRQGYIKLSSLSDPSISNWLPIHGVIVDPPATGH